MSECIAFNEKIMVHTTQYITAFRRKKRRCWTKNW